MQGHKTPQQQREFNQLGARMQRLAKAHPGEVGLVHDMRRWENIFLSNKLLERDIQSARAVGDTKRVKNLRAQLNANEGWLVKLERNPKIFDHATNMYSLDFSSRKKEHVLRVNALEKDLQALRAIDKPSAEDRTRMKGMEAALEWEQKMWHPRG